MRIRMETETAEVVARYCAGAGSSIGTALQELAAAAMRGDTEATKLAAIKLELIAGNIAHVFSDIFAAGRKASAYV